MNSTQTSSNTSSIYPINDYSENKEFKNESYESEDDCYGFGIGYDDIKQNIDPYSQELQVNQYLTDLLNKKENLKIGMQT